MLDLFEDFCKIHMNRISLSEKSNKEENPKHIASQSDEQTLNDVFFSHQDPKRQTPNQSDYNENELRVYIYREELQAANMSAIFREQKNLRSQKHPLNIYIYKTGYTYEMHIWCRFVYPIDLYQSAFFSQTLSVNSFVF